MDPALTAEGAALLAGALTGPGAARAAAATAKWLPVPDTQVRELTERVMTADPLPLLRQWLTEHAHIAGFEEGLRALLAELRKPVPAAEPAAEPAPGHRPAERAGDDADGRTATGRDWTGPARLGPPPPGPREPGEKPWPV